MEDKSNIDVAVFVAGNETYGIQRSLISQYSASSKYGINFHYVCMQNGDLSEKLIGMGANVTIIGGTRPSAYPPSLLRSLVILLSSVTTSVGTYRNLRRFLRRTNPDIVYTHLITEHILGGMAAKRCNIKSIGHFRRMLNTKRNCGLSRVLLSLLADCTLDMGIAVSNSARASLWGPIKRKTKTIYNGVDICGTYEISKRLGNDPDCPSADIICVGRIAPIKKQHILIHALEILSREGLHFKSLFVGGGANESNCYYRELKHRILRHRLEQEVTFTGFLSDFYGMISRATASVLCCTREGCPNAVVESMACRTPVVVADAGGAGELVSHGETGLKYSPDDPESLARCLKRLLSDSRLRADIAERAFIWAEEMFDNDKYMTELRQIFEHVTGKRY